MKLLKRKLLLQLLDVQQVGKDYIAKRLSKILYYPLVVSHTTRQKRKKETNGVEHWFNTKEEFQNVLDNQTVIAYTKIGEYEYCATLDDIQDNCIYVIDPNGIKHLREHFGNEINLVVVYVYCDKEIRQARASERSDYMSAWHKRNKDEDRQFTEFEMNRDWDTIIDNSNVLDIEAIKNRVKEAIKIKIGE